MQAMSFFIGGLPMLFSGDETATINDYDYLGDPGKSYDNRWMHRARMDWERVKELSRNPSPQAIVFAATKKLLALRKSLSVVADHSNLEWLDTGNDHVAGFVRAFENKRLYALFNFSSDETSVSWHVLNQRESFLGSLKEVWTDQSFVVGPDHEPLIFAPYRFYLFVR